MTCYYPLQAYRGRKQSASGKIPIVFKPEDSNGQKIQLSCGQCTGCRIAKTREWAIRCVHEASMHEDNSFITLTYDQKHIPPDGSLNIAHWQKFMKRIRKHYQPKKIRYYHCGEYGSQTERPHYHACLFGHDFQDKYLWAHRRGNKVYRSETLEKLWPFGLSEIGAVTAQSAAYVARYIMKKITGEKAESHYLRIDELTGELYNLQPEYNTISRNPGIGAGWFEKFSQDVFPDDFIIHEGKKYKTPKYYNGLYEIVDPNELSRVKKERLRNFNKAEHTTERLAIREKVKRAQIERLKRDLHENDQDY